jgi:hypothetical protein
VILVVMSTVWPLLVAGWKRICYASLRAWDYPTRGACIQWKEITAAWKILNSH